MIHHRRKNPGSLQRLWQRNTLHNLLTGLQHGIRIMYIIDNLRSSLQGINGRNTRHKQSTHSSGKLRTSSLHCKLPKQRHLHLDPVNGQPPLCGFVDQLISNHNPNNNRQYHIPVWSHPLTTVHNKHSNSRHLNIQIRKHINKDRDYKQQHNCNYPNGRDNQNNRINSSLLNGSLQLCLFFKMHCHPGESHLQTTGLLTCLHHIHQHRRKNIRLASHGIRQGITLFHIQKHLRNGTLQPFILCLLA